MCGSGNASGTIVTVPGAARAQLSPARLSVEQTTDQSAEMKTELSKRMRTTVRRVTRAARQAGKESDSNGAVTPSRTTRLSGERRDAARIPHAARGSDRLAR